MGDVNQLAFVQRHLALFEGPYLEVGSKDYGSTQDLRSLVAHRGAYLGVDLEGGPGVDRVVDLAAPFEQVEAAIGAARYGTIFCLSVLEHCRQPFAMAENLTRLLRPGGHLCLSVPFAWKFHGYPSDYWRFTHEGVKLLFPRLHFAPEHGLWASSRKGEFRPLDDQLGKIPFGSKASRHQRGLGRGISVGLFRLLTGAGLFGWLRGYRYLLAPTSVLMIGCRGESPGD